MDYNPILSSRQREIVSLAIRHEFRKKESALAKRRAGQRLTAIEKRRIRRTRPQMIRIGFEKARIIEPDIPEVELEKTETEIKA